MIGWRRLVPTAAAWAVAALVLFGARGGAAETIRISGTGGAIGTIPQLGAAFSTKHPDVRIEVLPSIGSTGAVKAVLAGSLDIGLCGRPLTAEELAQGAVDTRYARTPFVFGVNPGVKESGVTLASVVEIYEGRKVRWRDGTRIRLVLRPATDSDIPVLKRMSREMSEAVDEALRREGMVVAMTDQDVADVVESVPGAFGGLTLALVVSEKRAIRVLTLNGVAPSVAALSDGSYPYYKTFCMITRGDPAKSVRRFMEFVRSPEGASILAQNGQEAVR